MNDQQAYEMGRRWVAAGFHANLRTVKVSFYLNVPDPRDPGNKGHAVAQLRERTGDPGLYIAFEFVDNNEWAYEGWSLVRSNASPPITEHPTEEDCITAALEATKP